MNKKHNFERGQALVLLVFAMVVLIGFVALAIDGGMVYSDRRRAQNAADAAALAGAGKIASILGDELFDSCSDSTVGSAQSAGIVAAKTSADSNDFIIETGLSNKNGVTTTCVNGNGYVDHIDVHVMITNQTQTALVHFVYNGPLKNTVEAITRLRPYQPFALGNAIVALNEDDCKAHKNGAIFYGNSTIDVKGGGVHSNGCLDGQDNPVSVDVIGSINYVSDLMNKFDVFTPKPTITNTLPVETYMIDPPDCTVVDNYGHPSNKYDHKKPGADPIPPGNYTAIIPTGPDEGFKLEGGLYCLDGDFNAGNYNLSSLSGVTIYLKSGSFKTGGNGAVELSAPEKTPPPDPAIPGVLIYLKNDNPGTVTLIGTSASSFTGTILAISGNIVLNGTEGLNPTYHTQLIGYNVEVGGTAEVDIVYDKGDNGGFEPNLEMAR